LFARELRGVNVLLQRRRVRLPIGTRKVRRHCMIDERYASQGLGRARRHAVPYPENVLPWRETRAVEERVLEAVDVVRLLSERHARHMPRLIPLPAIDTGNLRVLRFVVDERLTDRVRPTEGRPRQRLPTLLVLGKIGVGETDLGIEREMKTLLQA